MSGSVSKTISDLKCACNDAEDDLRVATKALNDIVRRHKNDPEDADYRTAAFALSKIKECDR